MLQVAWPEVGADEVPFGVMAEPLHRPFEPPPCECPGVEDDEIGEEGALLEGPVADARRRSEEDDEDEGEFELEGDDDFDDDDELDDDLDDVEDDEDFDDDDDDFDDDDADDDA